MKRKPPENNVRRVRHINGNKIGNMYARDGSILQFESELMRIHLMTLIRDRRVIGIVTEPLTIKFVDSKGKKRSYTPDCKVTLQSGDIEIQEVTVSSRREKESSIEREKAGRQYCIEEGATYKVITELDLPQKTELANLRALYPFASEAYFSRDVEVVMVETLSSMPRMKVTELIRAIASETSLPNNVIFSALCHAAWHFRIIFSNQQLIFFRGVPNRKLWVCLPEFENAL